MQITLKATGIIDTVHGVRARKWKGKTESGIEVEAWIPFLQVRRDADCTQFERELSEVDVEQQLVSFDYRMVI